MIGLQSSLDRILLAIQAQSMGYPGHPPFQPNGEQSRDREASAVCLTFGGHRVNIDLFGDPTEVGPNVPPTQRSFPPLPGFAPPVSAFSHNSYL